MKELLFVEGFCTTMFYYWNNLLLYRVPILESVHFWYKITLGILNIFYVQVKTRGGSYGVPKPLWMSYVSFCSKGAPQSFSAQGKKSWAQILSGSGENTQPGWRTSQIWAVRCISWQMDANTHSSLNHPYFNIQALLKGLGWCEPESKPAPVGFHSAGKTNK